MLVECAPQGQFAGNPIPESWDWATGKPAGSFNSLHQVLAAPLASWRKRAGGRKASPKSPGPDFLSPLLACHSQHPRAWREGFLGANDR